LLSQLSHAFTVFMGLFAIMNPVANTPIFLGLTSDESDSVRRKVARRAVIYAFVAVAAFCIGGAAIFHMFGITLPAFRITGGVLVFLIGFQMLHGEQSRVHNPSEADQNLDAQLEVAVSPLAVPILAGPGTITTAMSFASDGSAWTLPITIGAFSLLCLITYAFFVSGEGLIGYIGHGGAKVVTRYMGLILAVVGVQMLLEGIKGIWY